LKICAAVFDITIPAASSLKEKRQQVKSIIDTFRRNFNVSASEVAYHDKWQHAAIGVVWISMTPPKDDSLLSALRNLIDSKREVFINNVERADY